LRNVGKGRSAAAVVLVGLDMEEIGHVREAISTEALLPTSSVPFGDAIAVVKRSRPDVVIIGFHQSMEAALALGQALAKEVSHLTMVALSKKSNADAILAAMRVGYKEYIVLPDDAARLRATVKNAAFAPSDDEEKGLVFAMIGAKGGVGTTLLATHLAAELAAIHKVLCIDLDFSVGDVASLMDVSAKDTLIDVLPRADRLDERMLTGSVSTHSSKVQVLAQPSELERIGEVRGDDLYGLVEVAARGYQYVVLDCGVRFDDITAVALAVADVVVLVTTPDVIAVRDAYRRMKLFEANGLERDRVKLVLNRWQPGAFVKPDVIEQNLGLKIVQKIADDPKTVDSAINQGKLLRVVNKKSEAARDISSLVAQLTDGGEGGPEEEPESSGFFASLFKLK
jgi:pilus assembly protein CpaE